MRDCSPTGSARQRERGFSLVETAVATATIVIVLVASGGVFLSTNGQRRQSAARGAVLQAAVGVFEEIRAVDPLTVPGTFHGTTRNVVGVDGANAGGAALSVSVQSVATKLLEITISGAWRIGDDVETIDLTTRVFSPDA